MQCKLPTEVDQLVFPIDDVTRDSMAGMPPNGQTVIVDAYLQGLLGNAWHICHHHQPLPRLVDIDWRRHITLVMACALRRVRGLDFRGYNRLLCHGWFLSFCKRRGARLAYLHEIGRAH